MNPNIYFIGATKCATTSLHHIFNVNTQLDCGSVKEPMFLMRDYWKGQAELDRLYPSSKVSADFNPRNCLYPWVADRIEEQSGLDAKIVLVVRDPIARMYSEICHFKRMRPGRLIGSPDEIALANLETYNPNKFPDEYSYMKQADQMGGNYEHTFVEMSMYTDHIKRFKRFDMKVIVFEDFVANHQAALNDISDFIGISRFESGNVKLNSKSDGKGFSAPVELALRKHFAPMVKELSNTLQVTLEGWEI